MSTSKAVSRFLVAFTLMFSAATQAPAQVPAFPQTLPANSVVGRMGIGSGPAQAISFLVLTKALVANSTFTINGVDCGLGASCTIPAGVASISGLQGAFTLSNGITNVGNDIRLSPIPNGTVLGNVSGGTATPTPIVPCPAGWICASNYPDAPSAVNALNAAGGGHLYFDKNVTVSSTLNITVPATVSCKTNQTTIATTSTTLDLLVLSGNPITVRDCRFAFAGTPGTKNAGALVKPANINTTLDNLNFGETCFFCVQVESVIANLSNLLFEGNFGGPPAANSAAIAIGYATGNEITHLLNITIGASPDPNYYSRSLWILAGAIDGANLELIHGKVGIAITPRPGKSAFFKMATSYIDNCLSYCLQVDTSLGGTVGYVEIGSSELGSYSTTDSSVLVTTAAGGNIGKVSIQNSSIFSYRANSGQAIFLSGSLGNIQLNGNDIGDAYATAVFVQSGASVPLIMTGNNFRSTANVLFNSAGAGLLNPAVANNRYNGKTYTAGGSSTTYVVNNVP